MKFLMQVVCCLAIVLFNNQSTLASPLNGSDQIYLIQLAASSEPDMNRFKNVKRYGYLYTSTTNTGVQKVLLGSYSSKSAAKSILSKVKARGHKDAFVTSQPIDPNGKIYSVQIISYAYASKINWEKFQQMGDVRIDPSSGKIKLMRGTFYDQESARAYAKSIETEGYQGAFIRELNEGVLLWPDNNYFISTTSGIIASTTTGTTTTTIAAPTKAKTVTDGFTDPYQSTVYTSLTDYEKKQVVYLDGVLNIKKDGKFIPLTDYEPGSLSSTTIIHTTSSNIVSTPTTTTTTVSSPTVTHVAPVSTPVAVEQPQVVQPAVVPVETPMPVETVVSTGMTAKGGDVVVNDLAAASWKIQLTAVSMYDPMKFSNVNHLGTVDLEDSNNGVKRIMLGTFITKEDATQALSQIKEKGFGNAYIVEYQNGTRK